MRSKPVILLGAAILIVGLFLPVASVHNVDSNLLMPPGQAFSVDGLILLVCAGLAAFLALARRGRWALTPGLIALGFLAYDFTRLQQALGGAARGVSPEAAALIARAGSINFLGWGVMGLGALLIMAGALTAGRVARAA